VPAERHLGEPGPCPRMWHSERSRPEPVSST
jgi:hypothetical protein